MQQFNWQTAAKWYAPIWKSHHQIISFNFMCFGFFSVVLKFAASFVIIDFNGLHRLFAFEISISLQNSARITFTIENHHRYYLLKVTFFNLKGSFMILIGTECHYFGHVNLSCTAFFCMSDSLIQTNRNAKIKPLQVIYLSRKLKAKWFTENKNRKNTRIHAQEE